MALYVDVILPVPLKQLFTYGYSSEMDSEIAVGSRVIVQFGKKKYYTGIVYRKYKADEKKEVDIKEVVGCLDAQPLINARQMRLWEWLASYYMCGLGDVFKAAIPVALKLESDTFVMLTTDQAIDDLQLSKHERVIVSYMQQGVESKYYRVSEFEKICGIKNVFPHINALQQKKIIDTVEALDEGYKDKQVDFIRLFRPFKESELNQILNGMRRAAKQYKALVDFLAMKQESVQKTDFIKTYGLSSAVINELVKKEILAIEKVKVNRIDYGDTDFSVINALSTEQDRALSEIKDSFNQFDISLLYGVTGSGKTEVYIHLIREYLEQGKQVLYLVPEIALTTQITERLRVIFGDVLAVYHSKFNDMERAETWNKLQNGRCKLILGARSSIFLPFDNLGLVIVDEEHEASYKQQEPSPRYNAKNTALMLANIHGAKTLLGTATPSVETYYYAMQKRYGLIKLDNRFSDSVLPDIQIENIRELRRTKQLKSILAPALIAKIKETLEKNRQVILFQNRRGFAPYIECNACAWTPNCKKCDVSLTFHKNANIMVCHYCGAVYKVPPACPNCENTNIEAVGYGTERVEQEVAQLFPEAKISRMDLDTTRGKTAYQTLIADFAVNKTNILIGTQMVSKGLDFEKVDVVGVVNANSLLNYPNFRAHERAFQMLTQVSGRAGRQNKKGTVYFQTTEPEHPVIQFVQKNDYTSFFQLQLEERRLFKYPPFFRLIEIVFRAKDEHLLEEAVKCYTPLLKKIFSTRVFGPSRPPVSRVQTYYIRKVLLKIENNVAIAPVREHLEIVEKDLLLSGIYKSVLIHYDVDPV